MALVAYEEPKKKGRNLFFVSWMRWGSGGECLEEFEAAGLTWR